MGHGAVQGEVSTCSEVPCSRGHPSESEEVPGGASVLHDLCGLPSCPNHLIPRCAYLAVLYEFSVSYLIIANKRNSSKFRRNAPGAGPHFSANRIAWSRTHSNVWPTGRAMNSIIFSILLILQHLLDHR